VRFFSSKRRRTMKVKKEKSVRQFRKRFVDSKSVVIRLSTCYVFLDRWIVLTLDFLDWFSGMTWIYGNLTVVLTLQSIVDRWVGFIFLSFRSMWCSKFGVCFESIYFKEEQFHRILKKTSSVWIYFESATCGQEYSVHMFGYFPFLRYSLALAKRFTDF